MGNNTKPASELSNGQAVNGTTPIPSVMPTEIRQPHDLGVSGYGCPLPDCDATLDALDALVAHVTAHTATATDENVDPKSTPEYKATGLTIVWGDGEDGGQKQRKVVFESEAWAEWAVSEQGLGLAKRWVYDTEHAGWHSWDGRRWKHRQEASLAADTFWHEVITDKRLDAKVRTHARSEYRHTKPALRVKVSRALALKMVGVVPVANGMFSLSDGTLREFNPDTDTHRAIIATPYLAELTDDECIAEIRGWFTPGGEAQLDEFHLNLFVDMVGLALSGQAQSFRPICFLWGNSGGGKGGSRKLLATMMGEMALPINANTMLFNRNGSSTHNADLADLIMKQHPIAHSGEVRGRSSDQFLQATGDEELSARYPNQSGGMITGTIPAMFFLDTTRPPEMETERGYLRREVVVKFNDTQMGDDKERPEPTAWQKAALLTIGLRRAMLVGKQGYQAPQSRPDVQDAFLQISDPLRDHLRDLESANELHGAAVAQIIRTYDPPDDKRKATIKRISAILEAPTFGSEHQWVIQSVRESPNQSNGGARSRHHFACRKDAMPNDETLQEWVRQASGVERGVQVDRQASALIDMGVSK